MILTLETTTRILICFNTNLFDWETKHFVHGMTWHCTNECLYIKHGNESMRKTLELH